MCATAMLTPAAGPCRSHSGPHFPWGEARSFGGRRVGWGAALQGNNKPQTPKSWETAAKPWGWRGGGKRPAPNVPHDAPTTFPRCSHDAPTTLPRCSHDAPHDAPRAVLCHRHGDVAASTVPLGGPWLRLPGPLALWSGTMGRDSCRAASPSPGSHSAARNRSAFNRYSINYSAALIINFLHSEPVPGESPALLASVQREPNFPPSAGGPTPTLLVPPPQTMPKKYSQRQFCMRWEVSMSPKKQRRIKRFA